MHCSTEHGVESSEIDEADEGDDLGERNPYIGMARGVPPPTVLRLASFLVDVISSLFLILRWRKRDLARASGRHSPLLYVALSLYLISEY
jgi:hypothetical protein